MEKILVLITFLLLSLSVAGIALAESKIVGREVSYDARGVVMKGYLAYDENIKTKRPGVLVVHEW